MRDRFRDLRPREEQRASVANDGIKRRTVSFYKYVRLDDPEKTRQELIKSWKKLGCLGRIYIASEGINAQMNVPEAQWEVFDKELRLINEFADVVYKVAVEEGSAPSFYRLSVKIRDKIVADGLDDESFDVTNTGAYLTAEEFNTYLDDPDAVVVDMRNGYESEVGHFPGAILPDVDTFRDELQVVPKLLAGQENRKIALYCTGGIRCEKASAWLLHKGFSDVRHLRGGVIDYARQACDENIPNRFRGKNFVFDDRLGERISNEVISTCHLCAREKSDTHYHCRNEICHVLFLGCGKCVDRYGGYCSNSCRLIDKLPDWVKKTIARLKKKRVGSQFKKHRLRHG